MARTRLVIVEDAPHDDAVTVPSDSPDTPPQVMPTRAPLTCMVAGPPRPRWPRPRIAPPPTLQ